MLGGEVYVGLAFAQQLHGLAGFVFAKLIDIVYKSFLYIFCRNEWR